MPLWANRVSIHSCWKYKSTSKSLLWALKLNWLDVVGKNRRKTYRNEVIPSMYMDIFTTVGWSKNLRFRVPHCFNDPSYRYKFNWGGEPPFESPGLGPPWRRKFTNPCFYNSAWLPHLFLVQVKCLNFHIFLDGMLPICFFLFKSFRKSSFHKVSESL